jgi:cell division protein ZapE
MAVSPRTLYHQRLEAGELMPDPGQETVVTALEEFFVKIPKLAHKGLFSFGGDGTQGLYLYGPVGRGKTMLMDMLYGSVEGVKKKRVHFHEFMAKVHVDMHAIRTTDDNALDTVAKAIVKEAELICFDEFQIFNIADAMILGRLFRSLFSQGAVIIATSNTPPSELYKDGLQRALFLPFIAMLEKKLKVVQVGDGIDHRMARLKDMPLYITPHDDAAHQQLADIFKRLTDAAQPHTQELTVAGRSLYIPREAKQVAWFTFEELCQAPLAPTDYAALCERYHTLIIENIPELTERDKDAGLRFIHLLDVMYEKHANAVVSAAVPLDSLMSPEVSISKRFERARSRLYEMQTEEYIGRHAFQKGSR